MPRTSVSAALGRAARDIMVKQARGGLGRFGIGAGVAGGLGYLGQLIGGHTMGADPNAAYRFNKTDKTNAGDAASLYRQNTDWLQDQSQGLRGDINTAVAGGDWDKVNKLNSQLMGGDFGPKDQSSWFTRTFLPGFAGPRVANAKYIQDQAQAASTHAQGLYNTKMQGHMADPDKVRGQLETLRAQMNGPTVLPYQRNALQAQMASLKSRLESGIANSESPEAAAIKNQMTQTGMNFQPFQFSPQPQHSGVPAGVPNASGWSLPIGPRPAGQFFNHAGAQPQGIDYSALQLGQGRLTR